jgi:hypothetical protein
VFDFVEVLAASSEPQVLQQNHEVSSKSLTTMLSRG